MTSHPKVRGHLRYRTTATKPLVLPGWVNGPKDVAPSFIGRTEPIMPDPLHDWQLRHLLS